MEGIFFVNGIFISGAGGGMEAPYVDNITWNKKTLKVQNSLIILTNLKCLFMLEFFHSSYIVSNFIFSRFLLLSKKKH